MMKPETRFSLLKLLGTVIGIVVVLFVISALFYGLILPLSAVESDVPF